jgi:hypothetical protein
VVNCPDTTIYDTEKKVCAPPGLDFDVTFPSLNGKVTILQDLKFAMELKITSSTVSVDKASFLMLWEPVGFSEAQTKTIALHNQQKKGEDGLYRILYVFPKSVLEAGRLYTVKVQLKNQALLVKKSIQFSTFSPPFGGSLRIEPHSGNPFTTKFDVSIVALETN